MYKKRQSQVGKQRGKKMKRQKWSVSLLLAKWSNGESGRVEYPVMCLGQQLLHHFGQFLTHWHTHTHTRRISVKSPFDISASQDKKLQGEKSRVKRATSLSRLGCQRKGKKGKKRRRIFSLVSNCTALHLETRKLLKKETHTLTHTHTHSEREREREKTKSVENCAKGGGLKHSTKRTKQQHRAAAASAAATGSSEKPGQDKGSRRDECSPSQQRQCESDPLNRRTASNPHLLNRSRTAPLAPPSLSTCSRATNATFLFQKNPHNPWIPSLLKLLLEILKNPCTESRILTIPWNV